jgi:hypothetical protein
VNIPIGAAMIAATLRYVPESRAPKPRRVDVPGPLAPVHGRQHESFGRVTLALAVTGAGLGLVNPPITNTGVSGMPPAQAGVASAVISATRQFGSVLGVAVLGDLVTTGVTGGMARGETHAVALSAATHGAWAVALACGVVIALTGYLTTTARAHATAAAIAASPVVQAPVTQSR